MVGQKPTPSNLSIHQSEALKVMHPLLPREEPQAQHSCRESLSYDGLGFSLNGENLRLCTPALTDDSAALTYRRASPTSARTTRMDNRQNRIFCKTNS